MKKIKTLASSVRPEEWLAFGVFTIVIFINTIIYPNDISILDASIMMLKYFTFGDPFYYIFFSFVCLMSVLIFYSNTSEILTNWIVDKKKPTKEVVFNIFWKVFEPIRNVIPLWLVSGPMYLLLTNISYQLRFTKGDIFLARIDYALFHKLLFIDLATKYNSEWVNTLMYRSYVSLSAVMGLFLLLLLFLRKKYLLRLAITAFVFSNILAYPIFYFVPAQGPLYTLIANIRQISIPDDLQVLVNKHNPSIYTKKMNEKILSYYIDTNHDNSSPISNFPSMHAAWSMIIVYFLWRINRFSLLVSIPWIILVLTGGLYFSQHYLVDYIASIPLVLASITLSYLLIKPSEVG